MSKFAKPFVVAGMIAGLAILSGCSDNSATDDADSTVTVEETSSSVAELLDEMSAMSSLNNAIEAAGLASLFEGPGSYTLLAPNNPAFEALGERGTALMEEDQRPVLVGLLRDHILPGSLTPEDISKAIADNGGEVSMTSFGGSTITFSQTGDIVTASRDDGTSATLSGAAVAASNGVVIPLDAVLTPEA